MSCIFYSNIHHLHKLTLLRVTPLCGVWQFLRPQGVIHLKKSTDMTGIGGTRECTCEKLLIKTSILGSKQFERVQSIWLGRIYSSHYRSRTIESYIIRLKFEYYTHILRNTICCSSQKYQNAKVVSSVLNVNLKQCTVAVTLWDNVNQMNNYIVRSYRDVIVITKIAITKFAIRRASKAQSIAMY